ncbi:MAG: hypothetical protein H7211_04220, partial [Aquabacterium sp.]|nr:hypothetical protein [Ferruginibacter sp.]
MPELEVSYKTTSKQFLGRVTTSKESADFIRGLFNEGEIELQEQFIVLYLNQANKIIGYYKHSKGSINATVADIRIVLGTALKCLATSIVVSHNHPSGNLHPSAADKVLTENLKQSAALMNIKLLDHVIITKDGQTSFADEGLLGIKTYDQHTAFVQKVTEALEQKTKHNKLSLEKLAQTFGITDKTEVKELTELAIIKTARILAHSAGNVKERFDKIVELYHAQVNLSHRTSQSILLQQYSTPAPIGYLAGIFCEVDKLKEKGGYAFEPSAGNGLLTIAGEPERFYVNELDNFRNQNLKTQGFANVWNRDATQAFFDVQGNFNAVITNPPFGTAEKKVMYDTYSIKPLEHVMALRALDCMAQDGKAAIIIGGHTNWDDKGRIQAGKNRIFFNYLYSRYHVCDVININGAKLYSRQGTSFDVRLILINGRKLKPEGAASLFNPLKDVEVKTFDELFNRVMDAMDAVTNNTFMKPTNTLEREAIELQKLFTTTELISRFDNPPPQEGLGEALNPPYQPACESSVVLNTQVPDSMAFETRTAIQSIKEAVGGDIDNFVRHRLKYPNK